MRWCPAQAGGNRWQAIRIPHSPGASAMKRILAILLACALAMPLAAQAPDRPATAPPAREAEEPPPYGLPPGPPGPPRLRGGIREFLAMRARVDELLRRREEVQAAEATLREAPEAERAALREENELRKRVLALDEQRLIADLRKRMPEVLRRLDEVEKQPDSPRKRAMQRRAAPVRELGGYISSPDATFDGVIERLEALAPYGPRGEEGPPSDARGAQRRLQELQSEASALRERLAEIELEIEMLRRDLGTRGGKRGAVPDDDPDQLPKARRSDGDRRPPNHPGRRGNPPAPPPPGDK
jgi:hypothetical protein